MPRLVSSQNDRLTLLLNRLDKAQAKRYLGMAAASGRSGSKWSNHALYRSNMAAAAALLQLWRPSDEWTQLRVCRNVRYAEP